LAKSNYIEVISKKHLPAVLSRALFCARRVRFYRELIKRILDHLSHLISLPPCHAFELIPEIAVQNAQTLERIFLQNREIA
jgi:hypothetical protein